ncbi:MAG: hypothetical protein AB1665_01650 [Candidatus Thermoplasmatota archaeon]
MFRASDSLSDWDEIMVYHTDPLVDGDTDGDGIGDVREIFETKTNQSLKDTDGDSLFDGIEVDGIGTDPKHNDTDREVVGREISGYPAP